MLRIGSAVLLLASCLALLAGCGTPQQLAQADSSLVPQAITSVAPVSTESPAASAETPAAQPADRFTDPFAYCAAITTIDSVDEQFVGDAVPQEIVQGLHQATGGQGDPPEWLPKTIHWRCMSGKVYACTVGANLPCAEKANTSQNPDAALKEFCRNNPDQPTAKEPASIYLWSCANGTPKIESQWTEADASGFLAKIWYEIQAP